MKLGTYSRYNLLHALLIKKMVVHLSESGYLQAGNGVNAQIGAVAPYSAQTRLIQALLEDALGAEARHFAATVHRFQGNEKDTMLVDLTDSTGCRLGKFMKGMSREDDGSRLLNVAISRARDHVILVANFEHLRAHAPDASIVIGLLDLFEENGTALDLDNILPLGDEDWIDGLHKIIPPSIELSDDQCGVFSEATFYPAFARDLETAEHSVVLLSPFLTGRGVARWANHFYAALQRGTHIRIVTRPSAEFGGASEEEVNETIDKLRELGVVVDLRGRMHEKVAIIDQMIAWHGSLNILSHRDTSESMLRLTGETACRHLIDLISPSIRNRDEERKPSDADNPPCYKCGTPTVLYDGRFGVYFECPRCKAKIDPRRRRPSARKPEEPPARGKKSSSARGKTAAGRPCPRPGCNGRLVKRNGRYGPFLGCSNYPRCRESQDL
jgi:ssDNA-binding Zn-finger/Zn-ribbon topoisomerase 1